MYKYGVNRIFLSETLSTRQLVPLKSMLKYLRLYSIMLVLCILVVYAQAQRSMGTTGLLNIPTADMQPDGTFIAGGNFMPQEMMPEAWDYSTGNYFVNMTFLPFLEVAYRCTLLKNKGNGTWNQDRSVSLRLRPLKEGKWWPSVVVGSNDAFTTGQLNMFEESTGNRFFASIFGVATKHFVMGGHDLGVSLGGYVPFQSGSEHKGVFAGVEYSPAFWRNLSLMAEFDSKVVNIGAAVKVWKFSLFAGCYDFRAVCAGVRMEIGIWK